MSLTRSHTIPNAEGLVRERGPARTVSKALRAMVKKGIITAEERQAFLNGAREVAQEILENFEANRHQASSLFCDVVAIHTAQTEGFPDFMYQFFHVAPMDFREAKHNPVTPTEEQFRQVGRTTFVSYIGRSPRRHGGVEFVSVFCRCRPTLAQLGCIWLFNAFCSA